ncbi:unnamed protein product, partial [Meganyctiphanes norvegica]
PILIMISTIIPTILLTTIGYATLYIKTSLIQVRLVVSLTTMLVMYTLFSQTAQVLPRTSYVKMVDIWFLFCISILFFIIIFHFVTSFYYEKQDEVIFIHKNSHRICIHLDDIIRFVRYLIP